MRTTPERAATTARTAAPPTAALRDARVTAALFLLFAGFYLLTTGAHFYAVDEEILYLVTESLVERRTFALPEGAWGVGNAPVPGRPIYSPYAPGQSLLAVPLYLLGRLAVPFFPPDARGYVLRYFVALLGPLVTAATVALLYRFGRALSATPRSSLALAAIYGLATLAWPHGRTFFAEPLTALLLLAAFYALHRGTERMRSAECGIRNGDGPRLSASPVSRTSSAFRTPHSVFLSGAAATAAVATKPHAAIALPILALYLLGRAATPVAAAGGRGAAARRVGAALLAWGAGLALVAAPYAAFNRAAYGAAWRTGYGVAVSDTFTTPFLTGLYGLTFSSGKGLLWYCPPVLLALLGWWPLFRRHRAEALTCLGVVLVHLAFYSGFSGWHGGGSWGPRFLAIALPFAVLPVLATLESAWTSRRRQALVAAVVALGVAVQLLGVLVNFDWYILRSGEQRRHFTPSAAPILGHARLLTERLGEWRARTFPPPDTAVLTAGFSATEGDLAAKPLFPRWTTGAGEIALHPAAREPLTVKLTFFDHRPAGQRDRPEVLLNGTPLNEGAVERRDFSGTGEGWVYQFTVPPEALDRGVGRRATVTLRSATWNPKAAGTGERDEEVGVFVHNVEVWRAGRPWQLRAGLGVEPMPRTPRWRFWWYNDDRAPDDTRHHLVDHWAWYAAVAGFGRQRTLAWCGVYAALALTPLVAGLVLLLRSLPTGALWLPRGPARRSSRARHARKGSARARGTQPRPERRRA